MFNPVKVQGFCPICERHVDFLVKGPWFRDELICGSCNSIPRERGLASVLEKEIPNWRELHVHESSPADRGVSAKVKKICKHYYESQYWPENSDPVINGVFNENLERLSFPDNSFDAFIALDVMEHVFHPELVVKEMYRTLKENGIALLTFPIKKNQVSAANTRAIISKTGQNESIVHLKRPEYHGNPIDPGGSLVTVDYGYDIHQLLSTWAPFSVEVRRMCQPEIGVVGEYTEVIILRKMPEALPIYFAGAQPNSLTHISIYKKYFQKFKNLVNS